MDIVGSFVTPLLDFSFKQFITTRIVMVLYGVGIVFAAILSLMLIVTGFAQSVASGLLFLILSPFLFAIYVLLIRVSLEVVIVLFRIAESAEQIATQTRKGV